MTEEVYPWNSFRGFSGAGEYWQQQMAKHLEVERSEGKMNANPDTITHLCETCKRKHECTTCTEIDSGFFDEVLMDHVNDDDRRDKNPTLTTIVVECEGYERD